VQQLIEWAASLSPQMSFSQFRIEFIDKTNELNLRSCQPKSFNYTFTTIWDTIHFFSLIIDDMVQMREGNGTELIIEQLKTMEVLFYNIFFMLDCPVCRDHYVKTMGYLILPIELIIKALNYEKEGKEIVFVDSIDNYDNENDKNLLKKNLMICSSMDYHNHINDFKWFQRKMKIPLQYKRMSWNEYKTLLGI
jgi:hypothetical protein